MPRDSFDGWWMVGDGMHDYIPIKPRLRSKFNSLKYQPHDHHQLQGKNLNINFHCCPLNQAHEPQIETKSKRLALSCSAITFPLWTQYYKQKAL